MSQVSATAASTARQARQLTRAVTAALTGRQRGPDHGADRRVPRRHSYEENDARAKPWARIGDGSAAQGVIHREALIQAADEKRHQDWRDYPLCEIRERRDRRDILAHELEELRARAPADVPIGRPAMIRRELAALEAWLAAAGARLRDKDVTILKALLHHLDFASGRLFPEIKTIAKKAGCHRNRVVEALRRLKAHGFIDWVRRTVRTGNEGEFAPQLEQTSNAYFFDHRRRMAPRTWQRYWQLLCAKLKRVASPQAGVTSPTREVASLPQPAPALVTPLQVAVAALGASLHNAST